jgi:hypothetical protein
MPYSDPMASKLISKAEAAAIAYVRASAWTIAAQAQYRIATRDFGIESQQATQAREKVLRAHLDELDAHVGVFIAAIELSRVYAVPGT